MRLIHDQNANRPLLKIGVDDIVLSFNMNSITRTEKTNMSVALQCAPSIDLFVLNQYDYQPLVEKFGVTVGYRVIDQLQEDNIYGQQTAIDVSTKNIVLDVVPSLFESINMVMKLVDAISDDTAPDAKQLLWQPKTTEEQTQA